MTTDVITASDPTTAQDLTDELARIQREHEDFRERVREEVLRQHREGHNGRYRWCRDGTERVLRDLDLPPIETTYRGTVTVEVEVTVRNANSLDIAENWTAAALSVNSGDPDVEIDDWSVSSDLQEEEHD